jgi:hypothetical protein
MMSADFHHVVRLLREIPAEYRVMVLHAAMFWSDEKLETAAANGDLPGNPGALGIPMAATVLTLVRP